MSLYTKAFDNRFKDGSSAQLNIVDFAKNWCGITPTLAQAVILKIYSGEELDENVKPPHTVSEQDWFDLMFDRGRFPSDAKSRIKNRKGKGFENIILSLGRRAGKALSVDTPLATPDGWTTMGEVKPGDYVLGEDGKPTKVNWCSPVMNNPSYKVKFSDGSEIIADKEHLWTTLDANARKKINRKDHEIPFNWSKSFGQTMTTEQMKDTLYKGKRGDNNHSIPTTAPLDLEEKELPVDPYTLGAWLGDGSTGTSNMTIHDNDKQIIEEICSNEYECKRYEYKSGTAPRWVIFGLTTKLRKAGVLNHKHIPQEYLRASIPQRMALLQGLMDTDGCGDSTGRSNCEFVSVKEELANDFFELAVSLGLKPTLSESDCKLYGRIVGRKFRIYFNPWFIPFRLERKAKLVDINGARKTVRKLRYVTSIESVGNQNVRCISVDNESKLYLAGKSMIPTHNSTLVAVAALYTVYKTLQHHNPQEYYGIQEGSIIEVSVAAKTGTQAKKAPFAKIKEMCDDAIVKNLPLAKYIDIDGIRSKQIIFITDRDRERKAELKKRRDRRISYGTVHIEAYNSNADSFRGGSVIAAIMDEFAMYGINKKTHEDAAEYFYDTLTPSIHQFGKDGRVFILSTPQGKAGKFWEIYNSVWQGKMPATIGMKAPTWECWEYEPKPMLTKESMAEDDTISFSWNHLGGETWEEAWERATSSVKKEFGAEFAGAESQWLSSLLIYNPNDRTLGYRKDHLRHQDRGIMGRTYIAHADPSRKGDGFAVVVAHKETHSEKGAELIVDHAHRWIVEPYDNYEARDYETIFPQLPDKTSHIVFREVRKYLEDLLMKFNISYFSFDQYNSAMFLEDLSYFVYENGLNTSFEEIFFTKPYNEKTDTLFEQMLKENRIHGYHHELIEEELKNLQKDKYGRIEAAPGYNDDLFDCLKTICYNSADVPESINDSHHGEYFDMMPLTIEGSF